MKVTCETHYNDAYGSCGTGHLCLERPLSHRKYNTGVTITSGNLGYIDELAKTKQTGDVVCVTYSRIRLQSRPSWLIPRGKELFVGLVASLVARDYYAGYM